MSTDQNYLLYLYYSILQFISDMVCSSFIDFMGDLNSLTDEVAILCGNRLFFILLLKWIDFICKLRGFALESPAVCDLCFFFSNS